MDVDRAVGAAARTAHTPAAGGSVFCQLICRRLNSTTRASPSSYPRWRAPLPLQPSAESDSEIREKENGRRPPGHRPLPRIRTAHQKCFPIAPGRMPIGSVFPRPMKAAGSYAPPFSGLAEQRQDRLRRLVGDRQSLDAKLLLDLQGLQRGAFLGHVGVDQVADAGRQRVGQLLGEGRLDRELRRRPTTAWRGRS